MKPSKKDLELLIDKMMSRDEIGKIYNISPSTVSYWFKKYGLKSKNIGGANNVKNLIGKQYGMLTVMDLYEIGEHGKIYLCKCECGNTTLQRGDSLTRGDVESCGCIRSKKAKERAKTLKEKDIFASQRNTEKMKKHIGEKYNYLTIIDVLQSDNNERYLMCKCDCGNITKQKYADLKSGKVKSCGCYQKEQASITGSTIGMNNYRNNYNWYFIKDGKKINCRSGYEVLYANYLILNNIDFSYEPKTFKLSSGKRYTPDFYLIEEDKFIEIKGSFKMNNSNQRENIELFKNEHNIQILYWEDIVDKCTLPYTSYATYLRKARNKNIKEEDYLAQIKYLV